MEKKKVNPKVEENKKKEETLKKEELSVKEFMEIAYGAWKDSKDVKRAVRHASIEVKVEFSTQSPKGVSEHAKEIRDGKRISGSVLWASVRMGRKKTAQGKWVDNRIWLGKIADGVWEDLSAKYKTRFMGVDNQNILGVKIKTKK